MSLKTYFGHERARTWFADVARRAAAHPAVTAGDVRLFVIPTYLQIPAALEAFAGTPALIGAQDVSEFAPGAYTGEVTAAELAEVGVAVAEIGHAERRRLFDETDAVTAAKAAAALAHGITPVLCIGEAERLGSPAAALANVEQLAADLDGVPAGPVIVAYEPVWAIGAAEPAPDEHIATVTRSLRGALDADPARAGSVVIYGGSAGPGLLTRLGESVDGLFLGRFAHDPDALFAVLDEAGVLASARTRTAPSDPAKPQWMDETVGEPQGLVPAPGSHGELGSHGETPGASA
ncbi:triose-phosphate isomerase family protein [Microbacterium sp. QXD-8]|uniref:Triosephosphate isomerase n=1 Tax=Microbacterium psychrotolerans TaxID=3068321 RepID=A0ABU0Z5B7_9MICO|nr:triose-phosphate isomerase family protein [Microbacterium sp. QXD-8]MDQ7879165.1 triose-phosphate isomerase family protein [Microbacterium sp. QXD-8]